MVDNRVSDQLRSNPALLPTLPDKANMASKRHQVIVSLERTARQLVADRSPSDDAVRRLTNISEDSALLGIAAGRALGRSRVNPLFNSVGEEIAALLIRAGADEEVMHTAADEIARRLRTYMKRG